MTDQPQTEPTPEPTAESTARLAQTAAVGVSVLEALARLRGQRLTSRLDVEQRLVAVRHAQHGAELLAEPIRAAGGAFPVAIHQAMTTAAASAKAAIDLPASPNRRQLTSTPTVYR